MLNKMPKRNYHHLLTDISLCIFGTQNRDRSYIMVIIGDDTGFSDIGCSGSENATPNLDRLAEKDIRFSQFCNGAKSEPHAIICSQAYIMAMTGQCYLKVSFTTTYSPHYIQEKIILTNRYLKPFFCENKRPFIYILGYHKFPYTPG